MQEIEEMNEHILVCLSSAPSNAKIIQTASRMADAFQGNFTALFIETPNFSSMSQDDRRRLNANMNLAKQLGAKIETCYGDNIAYQISEFARLSGVTNIVIGRSLSGRHHFVKKPSLTDQLIAYAPNVDIHIIPDGTSNPSYLSEEAKEQRNTFFSPTDIVKCLVSLVVATIVGNFFHKAGFSEANIIMVYILSVLITAIITTYRGYSLVSSVISVVVFNFFFTEPKYTLFAYDKGYPVTFLVMFFAAFMTGVLAAKQKAHAKQLAQLAWRTRLLFHTNQQLQQAKSREEIVTVTAEQLVKLFDRDIVIYLIENEKLGEPNVFFANQGATQEDYYIDETEKIVAEWVFLHNKQAGATTERYRDAKCRYLTIRVNDHIYGIVGIAATRNPLDAFENSLLFSILGECALALENEKNSREKEEARILAKNEQLRANLLRGISHDLRTPLTSIFGNASNLLTNGDEFDEDTKMQLYSDMYEDSMWLINLVENLLSVTRLEEGNMQIHMSAELIDEVIEEALRYMKRRSLQHQITVNNCDELILVKMDARLIVQTFINILDNAIKYTPKGSNITITTQKSDKTAIIEITDNGQGIPDDVKPYIFDMFYSGTKQIADSRRSMGLGLYLCRSIIHAHNGEICVLDQKPQGTIFRISLPIEEVTINE